MTREEILKKVSRLKQDTMRRQVGQFSPKLSQMATNLAPAVQIGEVRDIHYHFLALGRNPLDRTLFAEMVKPRTSQTQLPPTGPFRGLSQTFPIQDGRFGLQNQDSYEVIDIERMQGDTLLAVFDQKASNTNLATALQQRSHFYLGRASGSVKLPLPVPRTSGLLRVWLVPRDQIKKNWVAAGAELMEANFKYPGNISSKVKSEIAFIFHNVAPGEYLLKSIWDKRPGFEDREQAGPGDYESNWTGPITITAGNTTSNLYSFCTNRATTGGEAYYAADELTLRLEAKKN